MTRLLASPGGREGVAANVLKVLSGTFIAQLIMLASLPILSRIYSAEDFGRYQIYISAMNILLIAATMRYEVGLLSASAGETFNNLYSLCLKLCIASTAIVFVGVIIVKPLLAPVYPNVAAVLWLVPLGLLVSGVNQMHTYLPIREKLFAISATAKVAQSGFYSILSIAAAFSPVAMFGLIIGELAGRFASLATLWRGSRNATGQSSFRQDFPTIQRTLLEFKKFPLYTVPGSLMSAVVALIPTLLMFNHFGLSVAGQYVLIERFIIMPIGALSAAIAQVITGEGAAAVRDTPQKMNRLFRRAVGMLILIAALPCMLAAFFAPKLVPIIFGEEWQLAGELSRVVMLSVFMSLVGYPINMFLLLSGYQHIQFRWEIARFLLVVGVASYVLLSTTVTPYQLVLILNATTAVSYAAHLLLTDRATKQFSRDATEKY